MDEIKLLDHGSIRLVDSMGSDLSIVRAARVSYNADWRTGEDAGKDQKLIHYLMKNRHTSPFESVTFTFEVKAPVFVFRQWHRHRTQCLEGGSLLEFIRPCDKKPNKIRIDRLEKTWNPTQAKRRRKDQSPLSLAEHGRQRIQGMKLRCRGVNGNIEETTVVDVWKSGEKMIYEVVAGKHRIKATADHKFFSEGKWVEVKHLLGRKVTVLSQKGNPVKKLFPILTQEELQEEKWVEFEMGYRVSNLGRVQSSFGQGARKPGNLWRDKTLTVTSEGRVVVGIHNRPLQVSQLVMKSFGGPGTGFVCHKDDNPRDNRIGNLCWGTAKTNKVDSLRNGTNHVRAWVDVLVTSVVAGGVVPVYDLTVSHPEHNFVANNFLTHNCYNEVSARYTELPDEMYVPDIEIIGKQSMHNKQVRTLGELAPGDRAMLEASLIDYEDHLKASYAVYQKLLNYYQWPRELARGVLPFAIYSKMFTTINLHNLFHFIGLRLHSHAQHEIRVYAEAMLKLIEPVVPIAVEAYLENNK